MEELKHSKESLIYKIIHSKLYSELKIDESYIISKGNGQSVQRS